MRLFDEARLPVRIRIGVMMAGRVRRRGELRRDPAAVHEDARPGHRRLGVRHEPRRRVDRVELHERKPRVVRRVVVANDAYAGREEGRRLGSQLSNRSIAAAATAIVAVERPSKRAYRCVAQWKLQSFST